MHTGLINRLDDLRPAIRRRWSELLQQQPAHSPATRAIVTPAMLALMVDETLARLYRSLRAAKRPVRRTCNLTRFGSMTSGCQCGLHLLLSYYLAGARALRETLRGQPDYGRAEVLHHFNRIAHDEVKALCDICQLRGADDCGLSEGRIAEARLGATVLPDD